MIQYEVIASGSSGNAVLIEDKVLVDCGVPYKLIEPHIKKIQLVLLTHIHGDHFKTSTISKIARDRPMVRFGCGPWLVPKLIEIGVKKENIDVLKDGLMYPYKSCNVIPFLLTHDVANQGYKLHFPTGKVIYATDTANMNGIFAKNYDLYLVEANYRTDEIDAAIKEKMAEGEFSYELRASRNHLSQEKCNDFLYKNMGQNSRYVYMHQHEGGYESKDS